MRVPRADRANNGSSGSRGWHVAFGSKTEVEQSIDVAFTLESSRRDVDYGCLNSAKTGRRGSGAVQLLGRR